MAGHLVDEPKAANEFVGGNGFDVRVALVVKFDSKIMLEDVRVRAGIESWALSQEM
jgi:hypothetical protein